MAAEHGFALRMAMCNISNRSDVSCHRSNQRTTSAIKFSICSECLLLMGLLNGITTCFPSI
eukprot:248949-Amphidinium_carterae.1